MPTWLTPAAAKFWVALAGAVVAAVLTALPDDPQWLVVAAAALTALGVYLTPNQQLQDGMVPGHAPEGDS